MVMSRWPIPAPAPSTNHKNLNFFEYEIESATSSWQGAWIGRPKATRLLVLMYMISVVCTVLGTVGQVAALTGKLLWSQPADATRRHCKLCPHNNSTRLFNFWGGNKFPVAAFKRSLSAMLVSSDGGCGRGGAPKIARPARSLTDGLIHQWDLIYLFLQHHRTHSSFTGYCSVTCRSIFFFLPLLSFFPSLFLYTVCTELIENDYFVCGL